MMSPKTPREIADFHRRDLERLVEPRSARQMARRQAVALLGAGVADVAPISLRAAPRHRPGQGDSSVRSASGSPKWAAESISRPQRSSPARRAVASGGAPPNGR